MCVYNQTSRLARIHAVKSGWVHAYLQYKQKQLLVGLSDQVTACSCVLDPNHSLNPNPNFCSEATVASSGLRWGCPGVAVRPCDLCVCFQVVKKPALVCRTEPSLELHHHHLLLCLEKTTVRRQNNSAITHMTQVTNCLISCSAAEPNRSVLSWTYGHSEPSVLSRLGPKMSASGVKVVIGFKVASSCSDVL